LPIHKDVLRVPGLTDRVAAPPVYPQAEEDFNIEKVRIVQAEKKAIQGLYSRRTKQAEIEKKM